MRRMPIVQEQRRSHPSRRAMDAQSQKQALELNEIDEVAGLSICGPMTVPVGLTAQTFAELRVVIRMSGPIEFARAYGSFDPKVLKGNLTQAHLNLITEKASAMLKEEAVVKAMSAELAAALVSPDVLSEVVKQVSGPYRTHYASVKEKIDLRVAGHVEEALKATTDKQSKAAARVPTVPDSAKYAPTVIDAVAVVPQDQGDSVVARVEKAPKVGQCIKFFANQNNGQPIYADKVPDPDVMEKMLDPLKDGEAVPPLNRLSAVFMKGTFGGKPANRCKFIDVFGEMLFALTVVMCTEAGRHHLACVTQTRRADEIPATRGDGCTKVRVGALWSFILNFLAACRDLAQTEGTSAETARVFLRTTWDGLRHGVPDRGLSLTSVAHDMMEGELEDSYKRAGKLTAKEKDERPPAARRVGSGGKAKVRRDSGSESDGESRRRDERVRGHCSNDGIAHALRYAARARGRDRSVSRSRSPPAKKRKSTTYYGRERSPDRDPRPVRERGRSRSGSPDRRRRDPSPPRYSSGAGASGPRVVPPPPTDKYTGPPICFAALKKECKEGRRCLYSHDPDDLSAWRAWRFGNK